MTSTELFPIVVAKMGRAICNSRAVADFFGKRHDHVLRDIDSLTTMAPACAPNFGATQTKALMPNGGSRLVRSFDMTKDGFTLLAMGFTGPKALRFKLAYIQRFNEMETRLRAPVLPNFSNPVAAARARANELEQKQVLQIENQRMVRLRPSVIAISLPEPSGLTATGPLLEGQNEGHGKQHRGPFPFR